MTTLSKKQLEKIKSVLNDLEISYIFSSFAETNFGTSFYFIINKNKCRFSDHSVTNFNRLFSEIHFDLPYKSFLNSNGSYEIENPKFLSKLIANLEICKIEGSYQL